MIRQFIYCSKAIYWTDCYETGALIKSILWASRRFISMAAVHKMASLVVKVSLLSWSLCLHHCYSSPSPSHRTCRIIQRRQETDGCKIFFFCAHPPFNNFLEKQHKEKDKNIQNYFWYLKICARIVALFWVSYYLRNIHFLRLMTMRGRFGSRWPCWQLQFI